MWSLFSHQRTPRRQHSSHRVAVEAFESRLLFAATVTNAFADISAAKDSSPTVIDLSDHLDDPAVTGTVAKFSFTPDIGNVFVGLFDQLTPLTVANFLHHVNGDPIPNTANHYTSYDNTIIHRVVSDFIVQGGGFAFPGFQATNSGTDPTVPNEFASSHPNIAGTIAMAKVGGNPDSATNQFFWNLADNRSNLDNQNGGFTTFGDVLYNGMSVINTIAGLPLFVATGLNPQFSKDGQGNPVADFPLRNTAPNSQNASADANTVVILNSVSVVPELTITASSDNTNLVTTSIDNGQLTLTYAPGESGTSNITVQATDVGGNVVSNTFAVNVVSEEVSITSGQKVKYLDGNGSTVTMKLKGPGTATLKFGQAIDTTQKTIAANIDLPELDLDGTNGSSKLTITIKGGDKRTSIGKVNVNGALKEFAGGSKTDLIGDFDVSQTIKTIGLGNATGGTLSILGSGVSVSAKFGALSNFSIDSASVIKSLQASQWHNSELDAPIVTTMKIKGDFNADVNLSDGSGQSMKQLSVSGAIDSAVIRSAGSIGSISSKVAIRNSTIFAGARSDLLGLPTTIADFVNAAASISSLKAPAFSNSFVAAFTLGKLKPGLITTASGGTPFGFAGNTIAQLKGSTDLGGTLKLKNLDLSTDSQILGDAEITLF